MNPMLVAALVSLAGTAINAGVSAYNRNQDMDMLKYQNEYNSPENQMARGMAAGINPNALAQGIAGSPGYGNMAAADAASLSNALPSDLGSQIGNSVNNALNAGLLKANIEKTKEETKGMKLNNDYNSETFEDRVAFCRDNRLITAEQLKQAQELSERYPEMLDMSLEEMKAKVRESNKRVEYIDKQIEQVDQQIKESEQKIKLMKAQEKDANASAALKYEEAHLTDLRGQREQLELSREQEYGQSEGWMVRYKEIEDESGREAADKWLSTQSYLIETINEKSAQGSQNVVDETPQGSLMKYYQSKIDETVSKWDKIIADKEKVFGKGHQKVRELQNQKQREIQYWTRKMRRLNKGVSVGASVMGTGINFGT